MLKINSERVSFQRLECRSILLQNGWGRLYSCNLPNPSSLSLTIPGTCFSKVLKLFGSISGDIVLFVSSKRRCLKAKKLCTYFNFYSFYNIRDQLYRTSGLEFYEWLFRSKQVPALFSKSQLTMKL